MAATYDTLGFFEWMEQEYERILKQNRQEDLFLAEGRARYHALMLARDQKLRRLQYFQHFYPFVDSGHLAYSFSNCLWTLIEPKASIVYVRRMLLSDQLIYGIPALTLALGLAGVLAALKYASDNNADPQKAAQTQKIYEAVSEYFKIFTSIVREGVQATKYGYKAANILLKICSQLTHQNLTTLVFFPAIGIIIPTIVIRIYIKLARDQRSQMLKKNRELLTKIFQNSDLDQLEGFYAGIAYHGNFARGLLLSSVFLNSLVDSVYNYAGWLVLTTLVPPALITLLVFSAINSLILITFRLLEEYQQQQELRISEINIQLGIKLRQKYILTESTTREPLKIQSLIAEITALEELKKSFAYSAYSNAILMAMKDSVSFCSVIGVSLACLTVLAIPAYILVPFVIAGFILSFVGILGYLAEGLYDAYIKNQKQKKNVLDDEEIELKELKTEIELPLTLGSSGKDELRSTISGTMKGGKSVQAGLTFFQKVEDTTAITPTWGLACIGIGAVVSGATYWVNSHSKNLENNDRIEKNKDNLKKLRHSTVTMFHHSNSKIINEAVSPNIYNSQSV